VQMRSIVRGLVLASSLAVPFAAQATEAPVTRTVVQHRSVFDLVGGKTNLQAICGGAVPTEITYHRTAADLAAGIFSGWWYSPVHLRVTCGPTQ